MKNASHKKLASALRVFRAENQVDGSPLAAVEQELSPSRRVIQNQDARSGPRPAPICEK